VLQEALDVVSAHPFATTTSGIGALVLSEVLGFTRKGGIVKALVDILIALGRVAAEMRKESAGKAEARKNEDGGSQE
jgi:hypothetical protein